MKTFLMLAFAVLTLNTAFASAPVYNCNFVISNTEEDTAPVQYNNLDLELVSNGYESQVIKLTEKSHAFLRFSKDGDFYTVQIHVAEVDSKGHPIKSSAFSAVSLVELSERLTFGSLSTDSVTAYALACNLKR